MKEEIDCHSGPGFTCPYCKAFNPLPEENKRKVVCCKCKRAIFKDIPTQDFVRDRLNPAH